MSAEPVATSPGPVTVLSGHLVIYDDTAAGNGHVVVFRPDDGAEPVMPALPSMVVPILAKVLAGHELTADDMPKGLGLLSGRLKGVIG
jgi:hypothetical protein